MTDASPTAGLRRWGFALALGVVLLDQASKIVMLGALLRAPGGSIGVIPGFLDFTLAFNRGVSFGLFKAGDPMGVLLLAGVALAASVLLGWLIWRSDNRLAAIGYGLVLGGAVGNLIDRVRIGAVIDFIDVHLGTFRFWTFNIADTAITLGVVCLLIEMVVQDKKKP